MLVLSRKQGESIVIGNDIKISIVTIAPGRVRIGIEAPNNVTIYREEILQAMTEDQSVSPDAVIADDDAPAVIHNRLTGKFSVPKTVSLDETSPQDPINKLKRTKPR